MRTMKSYNPTHRTPAAIEAAVAEANARIDLLASYSEAELTAMGFDCSSYTDDGRCRTHFQNLIQEPIETILREEFVPWDPISKEEAPKKPRSSRRHASELGRLNLPELPPQPALGTIEDKVVKDFVLPVDAGKLGISGVAQQAHQHLQLPPAAGVTS